MKLFIVAIFLFNTITNLNSQVNVVDLIPGDDVVITLKNGAIFKGNAGTHENNILKVKTSLNDEYFIKFDSIQNIYSKAHKHHEYHFPERHDFTIRQNVKLTLYFQDGTNQVGKYYFHDKEYIHIKTTGEGIHKYEMSSIKYIKARKSPPNDRNYFLYGGILSYPNEAIILNFTADFKIIDLPNFKTLAHVGFGLVAVFGGAGIYGNLGLNQCFGSNGQFIELSESILFEGSSTYEVSIGYRYEKKKFIFRGGYSLLGGEISGFYLTIGF